MAPGTMRKPASRKRFSPQPSVSMATLSHTGAPPAPGIGRMSVSRKVSSTAFFSHSLTTQPSAVGSATRLVPDSSSSSAASTASRGAPVVAGVS